MPRLVRCALLDEIAAAFGATAVEPMLAGGSRAEVARLFLSGGGSVVAKYQRPGTVLVDGHELACLRRKAQQIRVLRSRLPCLAPYCVEVLGEFEREGSYGFVMPYYEGQTLSQRLLGGEVDSAAEIYRLLEVLITHGYGHEVQAPPEHFAAVHVRRVLGRMPVVMKNLPEDIAGAKRFEINGCRALHARELVERLQQRPKLLERLAPRVLSIPVHGDAVLSNFIWRTAAAGVPEFVAIDPRGTLEPWDPVYDFSKMFFSLSIYDLAMVGGFAIHKRQRDCGTLSIDLCLREERGSYYRMATRFFDVLEAVPGFRRLSLSEDGCWRERVLFATAMHCLAFAACRLVDLRDEIGWSADNHGSMRREGVEGFYLAGVMYLSALLECDGAGKSMGVSEYVDRLFRGTSDVHEAACPRTGALSSFC